MSLVSNLIACATCMTDAGGPVQKATNNAIFLMLGALAIVFGCLGFAVFSFARRSARLAAQNAKPAVS